MTALHRAVAHAERWLTRIYHLDLELRAPHCLVSCETARSLLPDDAPRTGVLAIDSGEELQLGLYVDPRDAHDHDTVVEETSHLLCLAWHATHDRPISRFTLELQSEVDRYAVARLEGRDGFGHFSRFAWAPGMDATTRGVYVAAHRAALRYCRALARRYPLRADTPDLLAELRRFYRAGPERKLYGLM